MIDDTEQIRQRLARMEKADMDGDKEWLFDTLTALLPPPCETCGGSGIKPPKDGCGNCAPIHLDGKEAGCRMACPCSACQVPAGKVEKCVEKLLKTLDMPEKEQWKWLDKKFPGDLHGCSKDYICEEGRKDLADLAFRLRDEGRDVSETYTAMLDVQNYVQKDCVRAMDYRWWALHTKPIHWIIAALIAKQESR